MNGMMTSTGSQPEFMENASQQTWWDFLGLVVGSCLGLWLVCNWDEINSNLHSVQAQIILFLICTISLSDTEENI